MSSIYLERFVGQLQPQLIKSTCPWCRCAVRHITSSGSDLLGHRIKCSVCGAAGPIGVSFEDAVERWNDQGSALVDPETLEVK